MTTFSSTSLIGSNVSDSIGLWADFVHTSLIGAGWVQTSDTGQATPSTFTTPSTTNSKKGYCVYRMDDALQSTSPVFMRLDFGSGASANLASLWVTIGTGSDGAGNITGVAWNGHATTAPNVTSGAIAASASTSYASGDPSRFHMLLFDRVNSSGEGFFFSIERSKDAAGADTGDGLLVFYNSTGTTSPVSMLKSSRYVILAGGGQPPEEAGISYILSNQTSSGFGADLGVALPSCIAGFAQQPGLGVIVVNSGDFSAGATVSLTIYGATRTYQLCSALAATHAIATGNGVYTAGSTRRVGIRYE